MALPEPSLLLAIAIGPSEAISTCAAGVAATTRAGPHHLMVTQRPATEREPEWVAYGRGLQVEELERDGLSVTVDRPDRRRHGMPLMVVSQREETAIQVSSANLDEEVLLRLAASMERLEVP